MAIAARSSTGRLRPVAGLKRTAPRIVAVVGLCAALAGCGTGRGGAVLEAAGLAVETLRAPPQQGFTATRESLAAAGFTRPLVRASIPGAGSAGLLRVAVRNGVGFWGSADGRTLVLLDGGVLRATSGMGDDLDMAETAVLREALAAGAPASYDRTFRHLDAEGGERRRVASCRLVPGAAETIEILGRTHATRRATEVCGLRAAETGLAGIEIRNRFWLDREDGLVWASEQWISARIGTIRLERVIRGSDLSSW